MKRLSFAIIMLLGLGYANAQVAQWLIPPSNDKMMLARDADIIITEKDGEQYIWNMEGECLEKLTDLLCPYNEGYAVAVSPTKGTVTAFYDTKGSKTNVSRYQVSPAWSHTSFHDGFLLVNDGEFYYYMNNKGVIATTPHHFAYPFCNGYALCINYENLVKLKNPNYQLIDTGLKSVAMVWEGKKLKQEDIEFISSVNDAGIAIVEAKGKVFFFNADGRTLTPVLSSPTDINPKNQARLDGSLEESLLANSDTTQVLIARSGKKGTIVVTFDMMLRPVSIDYSGEVQTFDKKPSPLRERHTVFSSMAGNNRKIGIRAGGSEMLPPQFDEVPLCFDDKAIIVKDGKFGLLQIHPDDKLQIRLNKGEPVGFRHYRFDTDLRIDMPSYVSPANVSIKMPESKGFIDNIPYETKETANGNYAVYKCELYMPDSLTDEATDVVYTSHVVYNQLLSSPFDTKCTAWHLKYFNVDISDNDYTITDGTLALTFNVIADRQPGENIYPHEARIMADSLKAEITERVSETRYKCKVHDLHEGINTFTVQILENGCPPSDFTFEVDYKAAPAKGEKKVVMKKKNKKPSSPTLRI